MEKYLIDANVTLAFMNKKDPKHKDCLNFFEEVSIRFKNNKDIQVYFPVHSMVEVNINIRKMKRNKNFKSSGNFNIVGPLLYNVDGRFLMFVEKNQGALYAKFDKLKSADVIYGMIAYIENMTLVTMDNDFDKVNGVIKIKKI